MKNPYTARLENELATIIRKRVGLRKALERNAFSGDDFDRRRSAEAAYRELAFCQREYERLHHELGRPLPHQGAIKLDAPRRSAPVRRSAVPYLTRMLGGR